MDKPKHRIDGKHTQLVDFVLVLPKIQRTCDTALYTLKTAGSFLTLSIVNYAPTKTQGQNYNPLCSQNNPFHGYFLTPFAKLVHS